MACLAMVYGPASRAMARRDWSWVAGWLSGRFGLSVKAAWVEWSAPSGKLGENWSDGSWAMWWKNRLAAAGFFGAQGLDGYTDDYSVLLHTGGRWYSTPEELARLANWDLSALEFEELAKRSLATPGIARTVHTPEPIDRTAARVVHANRRE